MQRRHWALAVVLTTIVVGAALPHRCDREDTAWSQAHESLESEGHTFAKTPLGTLHYALEGPTDGELVVLVHGVSGPMLVWEPLARELVDAGFRVLRFDHFGRGGSERVAGPYDLSLYTRSTRALLTALELDHEPYHVVGSSMGAIVAANVADVDGEHVRSISLIGPAGFPLEATPIARLMRVPGVSDYLMSVVGHRNLVAHNRKYFHAPDRHEAYVDAFEQQLHIEGSKQAILSTMQHTPVQSFLDGYAALGKSGLPVLAVWGAEDSTFPVSNLPTLRERIPHVQHHIIPNSAHLPMVEAPHQVKAKLIPFLRAS